MEYHQYGNTDERHSGGSTGAGERAVQVAERRRLLLDAAGVVFRRDGYLAATVDAIAEVASLTKGAVYSHFTSKADLFLTLLEERVAQRSARNAAAAAQVSDAESAVALLAAARVPSVDDPGWRLALLEFRVVAARDPQLNARYARVHDVTIKGVSQMLAAMYAQAGIDPPLPLPALARAALGMDTGAFLEEVVAGHPVPAEISRVLRARIFGVEDPDALGGEAT
jgi:AcrR family transcriptional regulator